MELKELKAYLKSLPSIIDDQGENRRKKSQSDFKFFVLTYFPHQIGLEDGGKFNDKSKFRSFAYKDLENTCIKHRHILIEAYRGGAKTTLITRLYNLWLLLTDKKSYGIVVSSTIDIAVESSDTLRVELEENARLINDFKIEIAGKWKSDEFIFSVDKKPKKLKFFGAGKKIRGTNFLGKRPDIIIADDIENDENVESLAQREKLYKWFRKAVLKLPSRYDSSFNIIVVGTRLHHDGLLARIKKLSAFSSFNFPLVVKFPDNIDELNKDNVSKAKISNMILDDENMDKRGVLAEFFDDKESFYSEYQNEPLSRDGAIFSEYKTYEQMPVCDAYYIGLDPAMGKARGDYFAIALLGVVRGGSSSADYGSRESSQSLARGEADGASRKSGLRSPAKYYLDTKGYKLKPDVMIEKFMQLYLRLLLYGKPIKIAIETVAFQEFFKDKLKDEFAAKGISLSVCELKNSVAKELRLDALAPYVTDGTILINVDNTLLIEELDTYPKAPHDDLLDASEMAFRIASSVAVADYRALNRIVKRNQKLIKSLKERYT